MKNILNVMLISTVGIFTFSGVSAFAEPTEKVQVEATASGTTPAVISDKAASRNDSRLVRQIVSG